MKVKEKFDKSCFLFRTRRPFSHTRYAGLVVKAAIPVTVVTRAACGLYFTHSLLLLMKKQVVSA